MKLETFSFDKPSTFAERSDNKKPFLGFYWKRFLIFHLLLYVYLKTLLWKLYNGMPMKASGKGNNTYFLFTMLLRIRTKLPYSILIESFIFGIGVSVKWALATFSFSWGITSMWNVCSTRVMSAGAGRRLTFYFYSHRLVGGYFNLDCSICSIEDNIFGIKQIEP